MYRILVCERFSFHGNKVHYFKKNFFQLNYKEKFFPVKLYKPYDIFPKNYNFLEKYIWLCYTTSIERFGEKHETRDLIRTD